MRRIFLDDKTGFKVKRPTVPIIIRDARGMLFYSTEDLLPRVEYFNLPPGEYFVDSGDFVKADTPRKFELAKLPRPERDYGSAGDFKVLFEPNPNKCSVDWDKKTITFDTVFLDRSIPETFFILYHELAHRYYETEKEADLYSSNMMKIKGFNPSQIALAQMYSLSDRQSERKKYVIDNLLNTLT